MKGAKQKIGRLLRAHREWMVNAGEEVYEYATGKTEKNLRDGTLQDLRLLTIQLRTFSIFYGTKGIVGLEDKSAGAWDDIFLSFAFCLNDLKLRYALWTRIGDEPGFGPDISIVAAALCFALVNELHDWSDLLAEMIEVAGENDHFVSQKIWKSRKFEPFALWLYKSSRTGTGIPCNWSEEVDVYSNLVNHWDSAEQFASGVEAVCDYHCRHMGDVGDIWFAEFRLPPIDLIPWEVLAIQAVRKRMGISVPRIEHPLLRLTENFVPARELPYDDRIREVKWLSEKHYMTIKKR